MRPKFALLTITALALALIGAVPAFASHGGSQSASNNASVNVGDVEQSNSIRGGGGGDEIRGNEQSNENSTNVNVDQSISQRSNVGHARTFGHGHGHGHFHGHGHGVRTHGVGGVSQGVHTQGVQGHGGGAQQLAFGGFEAEIFAMLGALFLGTGFVLRRRTLAWGNY